MSTNKLVLAEKPSVAKSISSIFGANERENGFFIGNGYIVSWCTGHLLGLAAPDAYGEQYAKWRYADLPIIPDKWKYVVTKGKAAQLKIIKDLINRADVECVINACDAGREGELIFRHVYDYTKSKKKIYRLWISSMEVAAIKAGFDNLIDGKEYDNLHAAASCRERADWVVGINATRAFSCLYGGATLNIGRVQSPTLAMIVKRDAEISSFAKEPFYTPTLDLSGFVVSGEKLKDKSAAEAVAAACDRKSVTVMDIERVKKTTAPPKLYDLTQLQRDANRLLGYTAQQTLEYIQSLYERKITSYPRTDSKCITVDMRDTVLKIIGDTDFTPDIDRIVGSVTDHHAIIPTLESRNADVSALSSGERRIFEIISKRLIAAVSPKHVYEAVTVTLDCGGHTFTAKGKTVITPGWKTQPDENEGDDDIKLPALLKGQIFDRADASIKEGSTSPPRHYTEDTLLSAMENAGAEDIPNDAEKRGLGTPATRAGIIERLIKAGFVERQKKNLIASEKGKNLIAILPDTLTSPKLTAEWENRLMMIQRGELSEHEFTEGISSFIKNIITENNTPKTQYVGMFGGSKTLSEPLGVCPRCGAAIREAEKGFFCDSRSCGFKLWRDSKFWTAKKKPLTAEIVVALLKNGRVMLKNLYSEKTGKKYDATVILDDTGNGYVNFKMDFAEK